MCLSGGRVSANFAPREPNFFLIDAELKNIGTLGGWKSDPNARLRSKSQKNCQNSALRPLGGAPGEPATDTTLNDQYPVRSAKLSVVEAVSTYKP